MKLGNKIALAAIIATAATTATAATKVVQIRASVDTALNVVDISGTWDGPITMIPKADNSALEKQNLTLRFEANDYKDVNVTLQSPSFLTDAAKGLSIPLVFKINGNALETNKVVSLAKTTLYTINEQNAITGFNDIPLTIESDESVTTLQSGDYTGTFTLDFTQSS